MINMFSMCFFLLCLVSCVYTQDVYMIDEGDDFYFNFTAAFISNTTFIVSNVSVFVMSKYTEPCLITKARPKGCLAAQALYGGLVSISETLCETNNITLCRNAANFSAPCPLINTQTACRNIWCMQNVALNSQECRNFPPQLSGYACGEFSYCNSSLACVDARGDSCNTTLFLKIAKPLPNAGSYPLYSSNGKFLCNLIVLATGSPRLPLKYQNEPQILSPGTLLYYEIDEFDPRLRLTLDYSQIENRDSSRGGDIVYVFFIYTSQNAAIGAFKVKVGPAIYAPIPTLSTLCPSTALAFVDTVIFITGLHFFNSSSLSCYFNVIDEAWPITFISPTQISCTVFPFNPSVGVSSIFVSNDGFQTAEIQVGILGSCDTIKPGSVIYENKECACPPGKSDAGSFCQPCSDGFYQPNFDQGSCLSCGSDKHTNGVLGATSETQCVCKDGLFAFDATKPLICEPCKTGTRCINNTFEVSSGYWRPVETSYQVFPCGLSLGGDRCKGGIGASDDLCGKGYEGPLCSMCAKNFGNIGKTQCTPCNGKGADSFVVLLLFVLGCLGIVVLVKLTTSDEIETKSRGSVGAAIKIFLNYIQLIFYIGTLDANWSKSSLTFFNIFLPMSISPSFISVKCVSEIDFYSRLSTVMILPALCATGLAILMFLMSRLPFSFQWISRNFRINDTTYYMTLIIILYTIHPMITATTFSVFRCVDIPGDGGGSFLSADMHVDCNSHEYKRFRAIVIFFVTVYVIGGPVWLFWKMYRNYPQISNAVLHGFSSYDQQNAISQAHAGVLSIMDTYKACRYVYVVRGYTSEMYLWEMVVLIRKMLIASLAALVSPGLQLAWASFILFISLCMTVQNRPFKTVLDNRLEITAHMALCFSLLLAFHSYFLNDSGGSGLVFFLIAANLLTITVMIFAVINRFRKNLHHWSTKIVSLFTFRTAVKSPQNEIILQHHPKSSTKNDADLHDYDMVPLY